LPSRLSQCRSSDRENVVIRVDFEMIGKKLPQRCLAISKTKKFRAISLYCLVMLAMTLVKVGLQGTIERFCIRESRAYAAEFVGTRIGMLIAHSDEVK
jgi:hypothetical protein